MPHGFALAAARQAVGVRVAVSPAFVAPDSEPDFAGGGQAWSGAGAGPMACGAKNLQNCCLPTVAAAR